VTAAGERSVPLYYSSDYVLAGQEFATTRKARWIADSLVERPIAGIQVVAPVPLTETDLQTVHDSAYVTAVRTGQPRGLAGSNNLDWDPALWQMVCASNGGMVQAALAALAESPVAGSLSSGLHHAKRERGEGYCTFNGLALAARRVLDAGFPQAELVDLHRLTLEAAVRSTSTA
jgi:acetoin utilization deacetylase AcuC-like enzyme